MYQSKHCSLRLGFRLLGPLGKFRGDNGPSRDYFTRGTNTIIVNGPLSTINTLVTHQFTLVQLS